MQVDIARFPSVPEGVYIKMELTEARQLRQALECLQLMFEYYNTGEMATTHEAAFKDFLMAMRKAAA